MDGVPVDLFDGGMPLRGIFRNIIWLTVSDWKNLGNIASCDGRQQETGYNFLCLLLVVGDVSAVCLGDDNFDIPKLSSSMRDWAEMETAGECRDNTLALARMGGKLPHWIEVIVIFLLHDVNIHTLEESGKFVRAEAFKLCC